MKFSKFFLAFLAILMPLILCAAPKITSVKKDGGILRVSFNQNISKSDFKKAQIADGIFYDIKAELTLPRQDFKMGNDNYITIAQNSKETTRIVMETQKRDLIIFEINKNVLRLGFKDSKKTPKDAKKAESSVDSSDDKAEDSEPSPISSLFDSIDKTEKGTDSTPKKTPPQKDSTPKPKNKIVVLDPGHGGKDCGAQISGVCEKGIVLAISNKLKSILTTRGYKVYVTRSNDSYISLAQRTKFANDKNADIFISIHANSLDKKSKNYSSTNGIESYFLSPSRSERARKVAEAENKDDVEVMNYFSKLSFLNSINSQRMIASNKLAIDVQIGMLLNTRKFYGKITDGGVREGPFWVLAGALMPSILIEAGYMTNKDELTRLRNKNYQDILAIGIADGIDSYFAKNF